MLTVGDWAHAQLVVTRPRPIASMCQGISSIEAMVRGDHVYKSIWTAAVGEEFESLAKNRYRDIVIAPAAALATVV
jgi:hypothetical protein